MVVRQLQRDIIKCVEISVGAAVIGAQSLVAVAFVLIGSL